MRSKDEGSRPHETYTKIVEVRREDDVDTVTVGRVLGVLGQAGVSAEMLRTFEYVLAEIISNVFHHSGADLCWVGILQYPTKRKVQLAIVDNGIGIRASLARNPDFSSPLISHADAITLAAQARITSNPAAKPIRPEGNGGLGLYCMRKVMELNGGLAFIQSGAGYLYTN